jgi:hypothetical protein
MGAGGVGLRAVGRRVGLPAGQDAMNGPPRAAQARADGARRPSAQSGRDTCAQASAWHGPRNTLRLERQPLRPFSRLINRGGQGFPPHRRFFACVLILDQRKNCPARCAPSLSLSLLKCCHERRFVNAGRLSLASVRLRLPPQLRQLCDVGGDAPGFVPPFLGIAFGINYSSEF